jgi:hypothetical protein
VRKNQRWPLHLLDHVRNREGFPSPSCPEEHLMMETRAEALNKALDRFRLVSGWLKV